MASFNSHAIPFDSPIFALAAHPSEPLFTAGLLSGHVYSYTWPKEVPSSDEDDEDELPTSSSLPGGYKVAWKTRRHKGSCRCVAYSHDGQVLYTAGTDNIIKAASTTTGRVTEKALIPSGSSSEGPTILHPLTPHHLLLGTDSGAVHLYDTRTSLSTKPSQSWESIHDDYISSLSPLPPTSESTSNLPKNYVTTGDSTLAYLDVRKGLIEKSEDQENEMLSTCVVGGVGKGARSTRVYAGMGDGIIHAFERGVWGDMCERIRIGGKGAEIDVLAEYVQDGDEEVRKGKCIVAGCEDGTIKVIRLGGNKVVRIFEHGEGRGGDEEEGVNGIAFDCDGSMISAGGSVVKIWYKEDAGNGGADSSDEEDDSGESDDDSDNDSDDSDKPPPKQKARKFESDSDSDDANGSRSSQRRQKKRKNKHQTVVKKPQFSGLD